MYESWYKYMKPKYPKKTKLCYVDLTALHKNRDIYVNIVKDGTSSYE